MTESGKNNKVMYDKTLDFFAQQKNGKLLDIGCGDGELSGWLQTQGHNVTGMDINDRRKVQVPFNQCDINVERFPFKDKTFDYIVCNMVMEHIQNPGRIIGEMKRVVKDNGLLFITIPNINSLPTKIYFLLTSQLPYYMIGKMPRYGDHITIYHPEYFNYLMQLHGLDVYKNLYYSCWVPYTQIRLPDIKQLSHVFTGVYKKGGEIYTERKEWIQPSMTISSSTWKG